MKLSQEQLDLIEKLGNVDVEKGLTTDEAASRREQNGGFNTIRPPVDCPSWICCLLPCIKGFPSMKTFRQIKPDDAEVKRNGKWIRYDAASLVTGDIIRLEEGDCVPADCVVLSLQGSSSNAFLVDHRSVTGEDKPRSSSITSEGTAQPIQLFWGGTVVQGMGIAIVTAIGQHTLVASLIREKKFPPETNVMEMDSQQQEDDEEAGISLISTKSALT
jgi:hypothetical protein